MSEMNVLPLADEITQLEAEFAQIMATFEAGSPDKGSPASSPLGRMRR